MNIKLVKLIWAHLITHLLFFLYIRYKYIKYIFTNKNASKLTLKVVFLRGI